MCSGKLFKYNISLVFKSTHFPTQIRPKDSINEVRLSIFSTINQNVIKVRQLSNQLRNSNLLPLLNPSGRYNLYPHKNNVIKLQEITKRHCREHFSPATLSGRNLIRLDFVPAAGGDKTRNSGANGITRHSAANRISRAADQSRRSSDVERHGGGSNAIYTGI